mgnify:FL=1
MFYNDLMMQRRLHFTFTLYLCQLWSHTYTCIMCQVPKVARSKEYISKVKIQYINARGDSANIAETLLPILCSSRSVLKSFPEITSIVARLIPAYTLACSSKPFLYLKWKAQAQIYMLPLPAMKFKSAESWLAGYVKTTKYYILYQWF